MAPHEPVDMVFPDGSLRVDSATLDALARNRSAGALLLLTNRHVLPDAGVDVFPPGNLTTGHRVVGTSTISLWQQVFQRGAATDLTGGLVVAVVPDLSLGTLAGMIVDTFPFGRVSAWHGDSGSVILDSNNEVVGLLFAMNDEQVDGNGTPISARGRASTIDPVLDAVQIDIAVGL